MNRNILQKILTELGKDKPSIDYLKGMVETLMETLPRENNEYIQKQVTASNTGSMVMDETEEDIPAHLRVGPVAGLN